MAKQLPQVAITNILSDIYSLDILGPNEILIVEEILQKHLSLPKQEAKTEYGLTIDEAVKALQLKSDCQKKWSVDNITERGKCTTQPHNQ